MAAIMWAELVVSRVINYATATYRTGWDVDTVLAEEPAARLEMAEVVAQAVSLYGVGLPFNDEHLINILAKYSRRAPSHAQDARGLLLVTADRRIAMSCGHGRVIESAGASLVIINSPEPTRYVNRWLIPGAVYLGSETWTRQL